MSTYYCPQCRKQINPELKFNPKRYCPHGAPCEPRQCAKCGGYLFIKDQENLPRCGCHTTSHIIKMLQGKERFKGLNIKESISLHLHQIVEGEVLANNQIKSIAHLIWVYYNEKGSRLIKIRCIREDYKALKRNSRLKELMKKAKVKLSITKSSKIYNRI